MNAISREEISNSLSQSAPSLPTQSRLSSSPIDFSAPNVGVLSTSVGPKRKVNLLLCPEPNIQYIVAEIFKETFKELMPKLNCDYKIIEDKTHLADIRLNLKQNFSLDAFFEMDTRRAKDNNEIDVHFNFEMPTVIFEEKQLRKMRMIVLVNQYKVHSQEAAEHNLSQFIILDRMVTKSLGIHRRRHVKKVI